MIRLGVVGCAGVGVGGFGRHDSNLIAGDGSADTPLHGCNELLSGGRDSQFAAELFDRAGDSERSTGEPTFVREAEEVSDEIGRGDACQRGSDANPYGQTYGCSYCASRQRSDASGHRCGEPVICRMPHVSWRAGIR